MPAIVIRRRAKSAIAMEYDSGGGQQQQTPRRGDQQKRKTIACDDTIDNNNAIDSVVENYVGHSLQYNHSSAAAAAPPPPPYCNNLDSSSQRPALPPRRAAAALPPQPDPTSNNGGGVVESSSEFDELIEKLGANSRQLVDSLREREKQVDAAIRLAQSVRQRLTTREELRAYLAALTLPHLANNNNGTRNDLMRRLLAESMLLREERKENCDLKQQLGEYLDVADRVARQLADQVARLGRLEEDERQAVATYRERAQNDVDARAAQNGDLERAVAERVEQYETQVRRRKALLSRSGRAGEQLRRCADIEEHVRRLAYCQAEEDDGEETETGE